MKKLLGGGALLTAIPVQLMAQAGVVIPPVNENHSLGHGLLNTIIFGLAGVVLAIVGYKLFDLCTPGDLHREILENRNVAAALIAASVILGVCLIIAAAIMG